MTTKLDASSEESSSEVDDGVSVVVDSSTYPQDMMMRLKPETRKMYKNFFIFFS